MPCACAATAGANRTTVAAKRSAKVPMLLCISISSIDLWSAGYDCVSTINRSVTLEPAGPETRRRQGGKRLLKRFDRRACMLGSVHILDTHYLKFFGSLFEGGHHVGIKNIALPWGEQFVARMN